MTEDTYHGSCLCEGIKYTIQGKPGTVVACYCPDCQKNAGGPGQMAVKFAKEAVKINQGDEYIGDWLIKTTASGSEKHKIFCKRCGCTLWTIPMVHGGHDYIVRTSLLEGGLERLQPMVELFASLKPGYVGQIQGVKSYDTMPGK